MLPYFRWMSFKRSNPMDSVKRILDQNDRKRWWWQLWSDKNKIYDVEWLSSQHDVCLNIKKFINTKTAMTGQQHRHTSSGISSHKHGITTASDKPPRIKHERTQVRVGCINTTYYRCCYLRTQPHILLERLFCLKDNPLMETEVFLEIKFPRISRERRFKKQKKTIIYIQRLNIDDLQEITSKQWRPSWSKWHNQEKQQARPPLKTSQEPRWRPTGVIDFSISVDVCLFHHLVQIL